MRYLIYIFVIFLFPASVCAEISVSFRVNGIDGSCSIANCETDAGAYSASMGYLKITSAGYLFGADLEFSEHGPGASIYAGINISENTYVKFGYGAVDMEITVDHVSAYTGPDPSVPFANVITGLNYESNTYGDLVKRFYIDAGYKLFYFRVTSFDDDFKYRDVGHSTRPFGAGSLTTNYDNNASTKVDGYIYSVGIRYSF